MTVDFFYPVKIFNLLLREKAVKELYIILNNLKLETIGNPEQRHRLSRLWKLIDERLAYSKRRIQLRKEEGENHAHLLFPLNDGMVLIDNIHDLILEMIARQDNYLRSYEKVQQNQIARNQLLIILGFISQFFLLAFIFIIVKKDLTGRHDAEKKLENQNLLLADTNVKLRDSIEKEKEVEVLLHNALSKEKEINELKSRFISTTSHEFRTPLTSILSSMQLVQRYRKKWSDEKLEDQFERVKNSIFNLTSLLDDILTISHADSGVIILNPKIIDLHKLCLNLIEETRHRAANSHSFSFNFNPAEKEFFLDPKLIRFIIINLLSNAFKYSPAGGTVTLNICGAEKSIDISVSDEGIGIPEEDRDSLFQPFYRGSNTGDIEGTGLGLSIVKRAVEMHKGSIFFYSNNGKGSKFVVKIPAGNP